MVTISPFASGPPPSANFQSLSCLARVDGSMRISAIFIGTKPPSFYDQSLSSRQFEHFIALGGGIGVGTLPLRLVMIPTIIVEDDRRTIGDIRVKRLEHTTFGLGIVQI